jgi:rubrerythrin
MEETNKNLKEALAGESQTNRRYLAFAAKAAQEGYHQAARLFRGLAEAETVHAMNYLQTMRAVKSTRENLQEALASETAAFQERYPKMIATAKSEGQKEAERDFTYACGAENSHAQLFKKALDSLEDMPPVDLYICGVCGYAVEGAPPELCPVCKASKEFFKMVE